MALRNKRVDIPKQLRAEEETCQDVFFFARANDRSIGHQILHYIRRGVEEDKRKSSQALSGPVIAAMSPQSVPVTNSQRKSGAA